MSKNEIKCSLWTKILVINILICMDCIPTRLLIANAKSNIGCLFVNKLCIENVEWCYDDYAFGKCLSQFDVGENDLKREALDEEQSSILITVMENLKSTGLGWDSLYVQCNLQGALFAIREKIDLPSNICEHYTSEFDDVNNNKVQLLPQSKMNYQQLHKQIGKVHFKPINHEFADENYTPPLKSLVSKKNNPLVEALNYNDPSAEQNEQVTGRIIQKSYPIKIDEIDYYENYPLMEIDKKLLNLPQMKLLQHNPFAERAEYPSKPIIMNDQRQPHVGINDDNNADEYNIDNLTKDIKNRIELRRMYAVNNEAGKLKTQMYLKPMHLDKNDFVEHSNQQIQSTSSLYKKRTLKYPDASVPVYDEIDYHNMAVNYDDAMDTDDIDHSTPNSFSENSRQYLIPKVLYNLNDPELEHFKRNHNSGLYLKNLANNFIIPAEGMENDQTFQGKVDIDDEQQKLTSAENAFVPESSSGVYTEGGLVVVPKAINEQNRKSDIEARNILANMLGFTRHERLDVKKPGPPAEPPPSSQLPHEMPKLNTVNAITVTKSELLNGENLPKMKKVLHSLENRGPMINNVQTEFTYITLKTPLDSWNDGVRIISAIADMLNLKGYLTVSRVDRHEIIIRVKENPERKYASDVAKSINDMRTKNNLHRRLGVIVFKAGVGDKPRDIDQTSDGSQSGVEMVETVSDVTHVMAYMFAGAGAAAIIVIVITLFLIRRHDQKRNKLGGLQAGLSGAETCSKDYQELCRARMHGKVAGGGGNDTVSSGRVASLSKENDRPPSSRSSTSSWSEEPAFTNMDISTGHMVLSYMEDHLRNKGRLQREWEALCRYEAEPSAREAATQLQCTPLNRSTAPLPYDHSRVVLNHLANGEGLDYINASTITDHDPRAPPYVAAQGPLPTTLSHFWQMIWEQGAVVIVALCRLQENGEISCARYWPEEGAEVYHIYEVHLVSEHIWCDDYLVRSFYLKNLRTGETRTVTQFHFLSWPSGGVPTSAKALLEFRRKVNKSYRGRSCPIVVHSSNGAGRTGAYILLDLVLARMNKGAREIDIAATLEHLRDQRSSLVASRQQFEFVLMTVAEEVHAILKALPPNVQGEKRELDKDVKDRIETQDTATAVKGDATPICGSGSGSTNPSGEIGAGNTVGKKGGNGQKK